MYFKANSRHTNYAVMYILHTHVYMWILHNLVAQYYRTSHEGIKQGMFYQPDSLFK